MSRYFTWFFNCLVLGEPNIYHDSGVFYKNVGILTWSASDCEELVGVTHRGMMGLVLIIIPLSILHFQTF